jgi:xanthine dehydrogenase accessory factor
MTHSHELDLALCDRALRSQRFGYVGVIGSATKRARFERRLIAGGLAPDRVADLVCPIGAMGPKSKLPQVIAAATVVELLVKDEICLKVVQSDAAPEREAVTSAADRQPEQSLAEPGSARARPWFGGS